ncbi:PulJ/GspJ family protein [Anaerocolumna sp. MB42-C2]|uniref:PulJ/GspJ family protein n=1 Tax=Anaerocolumna sp. MB42-C2 TaxID=3070997 RepID=UPI0027E07CE1|nr:prepilin-type N-terminal cleavage/methylation domain-containing protein [Anaerocolumna sp. MB42-C2]WMJ88587.1 prepilin-type N-terminal cleavage/methylation domain-containing protein [Anaerocolumna sp. MB42-C2]
MKKVTVPEVIYNQSDPVYFDKDNKIDNNGFTLIELIASMAIFVIVLSITVSFLSYGAKSYTKTRNEADLQMDSQIVLNQIEDLAIEAYWIDFVGVSTNVKALLLYKTDNVDIVFWDRELKKLYLVDEENITDVALVSRISYTDEENLMAENITKFNVPTSSEVLKKDSKIQIEISFELGKQVYPAVLNIHLRNKVKEP